METLTLRIPVGLDAQTIFDLKMLVAGNLYSVPRYHRVKQLI